jgi:O-glycosyl hydrolase
MFVESLTAALGQSGEIGIDRSNLTRQSEAVQEKTLQDIHILRATWFRDVLSAGTPQSMAAFVNEVRLAKQNGLKFLADVLPSAADYDDSKNENAGEDFRKRCGWPQGSSKISQMNLTKFSQRMRAQLDAVKAANLTIEAFEIGNEVDWICFNGDAPNGHAPTKAELMTAVRGYAHFLKAAAEVIRDPRYFPTAKIITFGIAHGSDRWDNPAHHFSNPARMVALLRNLDGFNYLDNDIYHVDGYGTHIYPYPDNLEQSVTDLVRQDDAILGPDKPFWITEWGLPANGYPDKQGRTRGEDIRDFYAVLEKLHVAFGPTFYYAYDLLIDAKGNLLPEASAVTARGGGSFNLAPPALTNSGRVIPRRAQTFRGWGMSLAWEANDLYGGGRQPAQIKDPNIQSQYMDLLYGDPATRLTLGFNIARYNIAGGDDPTHAHMRADAQMEGFQSGPGAAFDWTRDATQRRMLQEAKKRGANIFEAASYSPPYWMTLSGCSSGTKVAHQDNLRPDMYESFVNYLTTVIKHFRDVEGVRFESLEAFNEPDIGWGTPGRQEGNSASYPSVNALVPMLASRLKRDGLDTFVSGMDMNNLDDAVGGLGQLNPAALSALGRLNTHDYHTNPNPGRLKEYKSLAQKLHKPIWMSEIGCCFPGQGDKSDMWGALFMADSVRMDLRDMGAEAWVLWQPDWNVIAFDPKGGAPQLKKQYYALAQYTRFIRPGFEIISAGGVYNTLAAYSLSAKRLVLVSTNWDAPASNDLDLSAFAGIPSSAAVYRTTADEAVNLQEGRIMLSPKGRLVDQLPMRSVTTYVIDSVSPLSIPTSGSIEGMHQIVSEGAKLCLNINQNSTRSGEGIIPYPCSGFSNMEFNFVDQRNGFYSIHTVNGTMGLCLNVSNATASPGDGKKYGGPGNLIQWDCSADPLPDNELFEILDLGGNRVQIRVKSSGLCLEDPSRGGTIRQNGCSRSLPNQEFTLTE